MQSWRHLIEKYVEWKFMQKSLKGVPVELSGEIPQESESIPAELSHGIS